MDQFEIQLEIEPIHDKYPGKIKKYIYLEHFRFYGFKTNFKILYIFLPGIHKLINTMYFQL